MWRSKIRARREHGVPLARSEPEQVGKGEGVPGLALGAQVGG